MDVPYSPMNEMKRMCALLALPQVKRYTFDKSAARVVYSVSDILSIVTSVGVESVRSPEGTPQTHQQARAQGVQNVLRQAALANEEIARKSVMEETMPDEFAFPASEVIALPRIARIRKRP